ncbi:hypothetical protein [Nonomuraea sp. NPDC049784]|uniref:hypothetical protein n=1 Tax=Nonomuraea sp. NPDC049784 TaxID=3154361 RepID=UPI0033F152E8
MRKPHWSWTTTLLALAVLALLAAAGIQLAHISTGLDAAGISTLASAAAAVISSTVAWLALRQQSRQQAENRDTPPPRAEPQTYEDCLDLACVRLERSKLLKHADRQFLLQFTMKMKYLQGRDNGHIGSHWTVFAHDRVPVVQEIWEVGQFAEKDLNRERLWRWRRRKLAQMYIRLLTQEIASLRLSVPTRMEELRDERRTRAVRPMPGDNLL